MEIVYLINPSSIKDITNISDNLSDKYIRSALRESQDIGLNQILGTRLLDKLYTLVSTGRIKDAENAKYKRLLDNHIGYYLAYETITNVVVIASVKIDNAGAVTSDADKTNSLDLKDVFKIENYYRQKSDFYKARLQAYLRMEHDNFPELEYEDAYNTLAEIETAYTSSIFLGGKRGKKPYRPCYCPNKDNKPKNTKTIRYYVDNVLFSTQVYEVGQNIKWLEAPEKPNQSFNVWIYEKDGQWVNLPDYMPDYNIDCYAHYIWIDGEQQSYTVRYRIAEGAENTWVGFDNMCYINEPFEWLQEVDKGYDDNTREGWVTLTHGSLRFDTAITVQRFSGIEHIEMLDLREMNNVTMSDRMFFDNRNLQEFYPPYGLVGVYGYDLYNSSLRHIDFETRDGYTAYQSFAAPMTGSFCFCINLESIQATNQPHMFSDNGNLYNSGYELMAARANEVVLSDNCTAILSEAIKGRYITTLTIPSSVTRIEGYAVSDNNELMDVYFNGTIEEWGRIEKGENMFENTQVYVIHCTDGDCDVYYNANEPSPDEPERELYRVDFYANNEWLESNAYYEGEEIAYPVPPTFEGYEFKAWEVNNGGNWEPAPSHMPAYSFSAVAKYNKIEPEYHNVNYYVNGELYDYQSYQEGETIEAPTAEKEGHTFLGWEGLPSVMPSHDIDTHAIFEINSYKITYVAGDWSEEITYEYGDTINEKTAPVKEGYSFLYWDELPTTMPAKDITVSAVYERNEYKITYMIDGVPYNEVRYYFEDEVQPYVPKVDEGYVFSGWDNEPTIMPAYDVVVTGSITKVEPSEKPYEQQYLTIERTDTDIFDYGLKYSGWTESCDMSYSVDDGATWTRFNQASNSLSMKDYRKIMFKATTNTTNSSTPKGTFQFNGGGRCIIYGNIMSLVYGDDFVGKTDLKVNYEFANLFNQVYVTDASNLILPSTMLVKNCYYYMFRNCSRLTEPPTLPATTLADYCYSSMFYGCTSLTTPPELPATKLAPYCYQNMFDSCTSLTTAPVLPATTMASSCYNSMFKRCTSLTAAPVLPATTMDTSCYSNMFLGCTSLTTPPQISATTVGAKVGVFQSMFDGCTSLTKSPVLKVTSLQQNSYYNMFSGCTNLSEVTMLATSVSAKYCLSNWMNGVAETGTFYKSPNMPLETIQQHVPSGWTILDYAG